MDKSEKEHQQDIDIPQILPLDLEDFSAFLQHPWLIPLKEKYNHDSIMAKNAVGKIVADLHIINKEYQEEFGRTLFTTIEGRGKEEFSFFKNIIKICKESVEKLGITKEILVQHYCKIYDLAGVRFACPYFDEVESAINNVIRPKLKAIGYATQLEEEDLKDRNHLETGTIDGYRSYHLFVKVPTPVDIFHNVQMVLCEVQGRSELQHVWAAKSHDVLYKPGKGWLPLDEHVREDMKQLSNNLRAADQSLMSIRDRARGDIKDEEE